MWKPFALLLAVCCLIVFSFSPGRAQGASLPTKLNGKWIQHYTGMSVQGAVLNITSVDPVTGLLRGKWTPPSGAAVGIAFVTGIRSDVRRA